MPNFKFHLKFGVWISIIVSVIFAGLSYFTIGIKWDWKLLSAPFVVFFFSNLPDLDMHIGKLRKYTIMTIFIGLAISSILIAFIQWQFIIIGFSITGFFGIYMFKIKHRGITHKYPFILIAALPLLFVHWYLFILGYVTGCSHIFVDRFWSWTKRKAKKWFGWKGKTDVTVHIKPTNIYYPPKEKKESYAPFKYTEVEQKY